jgi:hypothetical protein
VEVVDDDAEERQPLELVPGAVDDDDDDDDGDAKRPVHQWTLRCALEAETDATTDATTDVASAHTSEAERSIWPVDVFGWEPVPNAQMARLVPASHRTVALYRDVAILRLRAMPPAGKHSIKAIPEHEKESAHQGVLLLRNGRPRDPGRPAVRRRETEDGCQLGRHLWRHSNARRRTGCPAPRG